ncbi:MAG: hypothetical protein LBD34_00630 [Puniceicoccales bacterium]|jgi:hypothetical protein|nr:hypothetical protein [Puniceicoccales bacterium]
MNNKSRRKYFVLACLAACLLHTGAFGVTEERAVALHIGDSVDTTINFSTEGDENNPVNTSMDAFVGNDGLMQNINVSDTSPIHGIYFSGESFSGKTLILNNVNIAYGDQIPYLIAATATTAAESQCSAVAIDLSGVHGSDGSQFTVALDNTGNAKEYRFSAKANTSNVPTYAVAIGVPIATSEIDTSYSTFDPRGALVNATVSATATGENSAYAAVFGAGYANSEETTVSDWTAEFKGNATIAATGHSQTTDNINIGTLGGDKNDNFRFYFNGSESTVVNIAALKLGEVSEPNAEAEGAKQATLALVEDQGKNTGENYYARAIALGPNFQLNVGRTRTLMAESSEHKNAILEAESSISSGGQPSGGNGTMNIFGAIGQARANANTEGSIIRIDSGWTVNAYGPVEDVTSIAVNNGTFNTYESIKNITLSNGSVNAYGTSNDIGTITINGGNLHITKCDSSKFDENFTLLKNGMHYVDSNGTKYGSGTTNVLNIDATSYPWKGNSTGGKLTLNEGNVLKFHVDSSQPDTTIAVQPTGLDDRFEITKGYVTIDPGMSEAMVFSGGKLSIVNDNISESGTLPAHADFWLVRTGKNTNIEAVGAIFGFNLANEDQFIKINDNLYKMTKTYGGNLLSGEIDDYAEWSGDLDVYLFNDATKSASGLIIGTGDTPHYAIESDYTKHHANGELATLTASAHTLLFNATSDRLTNVKGSLADPFVHAIYGRAHQDEIAGLGYNSKMSGCVLGLDDVWNLSNERYLPAGAIFGYAHGKMDFFGSATGLEQSAKRDLYMVELFGAYESFDDKLLKTNVGISFGYDYGSDRLHGMDAYWNLSKTCMPTGYASSGCGSG